MPISNFQVAMEDFLSRVLNQTVDSNIPQLLDDVMQRYDDQSNELNQCYDVLKQKQVSFLWLLMLRCTDGEIWLPTHCSL